MWGHPTAWGYRLPVWFFQAVSQGSVLGCGWSHGVLPWLWEWGPFPDLPLDVSSPSCDPGCSSGGGSDPLLDLKFHLFQGPGAAGHCDGVVILEFAGGLQLLLTSRGGGDGREDMVGLGIGPRDSVFSCFPASPDSCNISSQANIFLPLLLSFYPPPLLLPFLLSP